MLASPVHTILVFILEICWSKHTWPSAHLRTSFLRHLDILNLS